MTRILMAALGALLTAALSLAQQPGPAPADRHAEFPKLPPAKTIRVNGADLTYVEQGRGEAVILIHGFLHDYRLWSTQMPELSKRFRVIAYSMRHRWPNTPAANDVDASLSELSPAVNAADLVAFLKSLKLGQVHLVGHSGGAGLALRMSRDHPELVRSMVLGEPGAQAFAASNPEAPRNLTPQLAIQVQQAYEGGDIARALDIVREAVVGKDAATRPALPWVRLMSFDNAWQLKSLWTSRREPEPPVTCDEARGIKVPTMLLGGDRSPAVFRLVLDGLQKCLPAWERAVLPNTSHGLELDNPAGFNKIVLEFLAKRSRPSRH